MIQELNELKRRLTRAIFPDDQGGEPPLDFIHGVQHAINLLDEYHEELQKDFEEHIEQMLKQDASLTIEENKNVN